MTGIGLSLRNVTWHQLAVVEAPMMVLLLLMFAISTQVNPAFELRASGASVPLFNTCPFFDITGIPCLLCGMTRSFLAMGALDFGSAFRFHPLGPVLFILLAGLAAVLIFSMMTRRRITISISQTLRRQMIAGGAVLLFSAWILKLVIWRQTGLI